jgi:hypothetical protein
MNLRDIVKESYSYSEIARKLGTNNPSGQKIKELRKLCENFDTSHFIPNGRKPKWKTIENVCPVCNKTFKTQEGHPKETTVCSYSCSNTYFRSGPQNGNWSDEAYRTTCFYYHKRKCIICGEDKAVDTHHLDENRNNNSCENLIPLCPTHHRYMHSKYKNLIIKEVNKYVENFKKSQK